MIRILFLVCLYPLIAFSQENPTSKSGVEEGLDLHLIKKIHRYVIVTEARVRQELTNETYSQVLFGSYYRFTKRFRMGLFAQAEQGLRWDSDWRSGSAEWDWESSQGRWDYSSVLDATYADQLTAKLLIEMKTRLIYYHSRDAFQLRLRPGLRYFILEEGKPIWQLYSATEFYAPLNYGKGPLYEFWVYGGALYQFTSHFSMGPLIAFRQRWFRSYDDFKDQGGSRYERTFTSTNVGLTAVYAW